MGLGFLRGATKSYPFRFVLLLGVASHQPQITSGVRMLAAGPTPPARLILGSKSATRQAILREMGLEFSCMSPDIDEKAIGDRQQDQPADLVLAVARAKAAALLKTLETASPPPATGTLLLCGDQVVVHEDHGLQKGAGVLEVITVMEEVCRGAVENLGG